MIYTSGSTGRPKGVVVEHRNVINFFRGMDDRVGSDGPIKWLAVTSISFDISVLELFWTLSRGATVVIQADEPQAVVESRSAVSTKSIDFSLFYFASEVSTDHDDPYHMLFEGARFAEGNGFSAIWVPERHFHEFGGIYPSPAVISGAIAAITEPDQAAVGQRRPTAPRHHPCRGGLGGSSTTCRRAAFSCPSPRGGTTVTSCSSRSTTPTGAP